MEKRYFVLQRNGKDTDSVFTGRQPRQAALKAASRGESRIELRERGTKKIHLYTGSRRRVSAPSNAPGWMGSMVWKPNVRKSGIRKPVRAKKAARAARRPARRAKKSARKARRR